MTQEKSQTKPTEALPEVAKTRRINHPPEVRARLDETSKKFGQDLAANLNRNVTKEK